MGGAVASKLPAIAAPELPDLHSYARRGILVPHAKRVGMIQNLDLFNGLKVDEHLDIANCFSVWKMALGDVLKSKNTYNCVVLVVEGELGAFVHAKEDTFDTSNSTREADSDFVYTITRGAMLHPMPTPEMLEEFELEGKECGGAVAYKAVRPTTLLKLDYSALEQLISYRSQSKSKRERPSKKFLMVLSILTHSIYPTLLSLEFLRKGTPLQLKMFADVVTFKHVAAEEVLFVSGDMGETAYILQMGVVSVVLEEMLEEMTDFRKKMLRQSSQRHDQTLDVDPRMLMGGPGGGKGRGLSLSLSFRHLAERSASSPGRRRGGEEKGAAAAARQGEEEEQKPPPDTARSWGQGAPPGEPHDLLPAHLTIHPVKGGAGEAEMPSPNDLQVDLRRYPRCVSPAPGRPAGGKLAAAAAAAGGEASAAPGRPASRTSVTRRPARAGIADLLRPPEAFGVGGLLEPVPRSFSALTTTDSLLIKVRREAIKPFLDNSTELKEALRKHQVNRALLKAKRMGIPFFSALHRRSLPKFARGCHLHRFGRKGELVQTRHARPGSAYAGSAGPEVPGSARASPARRGSPRSPRPPEGHAAEEQPLSVQSSPVPLPAAEGPGGGGGGGGRGRGESTGAGYFFHPRGPRSTFVLLQGSVDVFPLQTQEDLRKYGGGMALVSIHQVGKKESTTLHPGSFFVMDPEAPPGQGQRMAARVHSGLGATLLEITEEAEAVLERSPAAAVQYHLCALRRAAQLGDVVRSEKAVFHFRRYLARVQGDHDLVEAWKLRNISSESVAAAEGAEAAAEAAAPPQTATAAVDFLREAERWTRASAAGQLTVEAARVMAQMIFDAYFRPHDIHNIPAGETKGPANKSFVRLEPKTFKETEKRLKEYMVKTLDHKDKYLGEARGADQNVGRLPPMVFDLAFAEVFRRTSAGPFLGFLKSPEFDDLLGSFTSERWADDQKSFILPKSRPASPVHRRRSTDPGGRRRSSLQSAKESMRVLQEQERKKDLRSQKKGLPKVSSPRSDDIDGDIQGAAVRSLMKAPDGNEEGENAAWRRSNLAIA